MEDVKYLKTTEVKELREKLHVEQDCICPICKEEMPFDEIALDHQHKLFKNQELVVDGNGLIRGTICKYCNSWEGRIFNSYRRYGLHKKNMSLPDLLRSLANYLEQDSLPYVHPSERPKKKIVSKKNYNTLKKLYEGQNRRAKFPEYPKSGHLTKKLAGLFNEFGISPYN